MTENTWEFVIMLNYLDYISIFFIIIIDIQHVSNIQDLYRGKFKLKAA